MPVHQTNTHIVSALFENMTEARRLVEDLRLKGIEDRNISLISSAKHYGEDRYRELDNAYIDSNKHHTEDGAEMGATLGGAGGFVVGLATVTVPGAGPLLVIGGVLAATITGAAVGGLAGGFVGLLMDIGIPEERAEFYDTGLKRGMVLVAVKSTPEMISEVVDTVAEHNPINLEQRMDVWERDQMLMPAPQV